MKCSFWEKRNSCLRKTASGWRRLTRHFPLTANRWPHATRWISLIVGCIGMTSACTVWQNAWQNAMRAIYNQTELEANLVSTLGGVGATISLPAGVVYELFGPQMNALIGLVMAGTAYFFLFLGTSTIGNWRSIFAKNQSIVVILYFFVGFGGSFTYMTNFLPNAENFTYEQRGRVFGLLDASLSITPTLLTILYNSVFTNGKIQPGEEDQQNLSGYFLTVGIITVVTIVLCFLFVGHVPKSRSTTGLVRSSVEEADLNFDGEGALLVRSEPDKPPNAFSEYPFRDVPFTRVLFHWSFWYMVVQFVLSGCLQTTYQANLPTYLRSFGMNEYNLLFTSLCTAVQAVSKFAAGLISDAIAVQGRWPRAIVFLVPYILQTTFLLLSAFYGDNFVLMIVTCVVCGVAVGFTWCQTPIIIGELFGTKHLASNWGLTLVFSAGMGFPFSIGFSAIYEAAITTPGEIYCYGLQCFTWSFILLAGASFASLIMAFALTDSMIRNARCRKMQVSRDKPC